MKKSSTDKIIEAAQDLFWRYGIRKVTVEEISEQAGVSKMTFYRKFENKFELAKVVLHKVMTDGLEDYRNFMERTDIPFTKKIQYTIQMKIERAKDISPVFIKEIIGNDYPELKEFVMKQRRDIMQEVMGCYAKGQEEGHIRADLDLEMLSTYAETITQMALNPALVRKYGSTEALIGELTRFFFYGVSAQTHEKD